MPARGRASVLVDEAAERTSVSMRMRARRIRASALILLQTGLAVAASWLIATEALGHDRPFFAPVAAIIILGMTHGQRGRRAVEVVVGVALGIGIADALVLALGSGTWQLGLVVVLAMTAALLLGSGPMLATQAAVSAALVVTLQPPGSGLSGARFVDALVGGGVALFITSVLLPTNPVALVRRAAAPVIGELASVLEDIADALAGRDRGQAEQALLRARAIDAEEVRLREALDVGRETARSAPPRRGTRGHLELYAIAAGQIDLAVRNTRVLARGAIRAIELEDNVPPQVPEALRDLAAAVRGLGDHLADPEGSGGEAREAALRAAATASAVLEQTANLSVSVIIGQVRSTAVDLLRGMGEDAAGARAAVREVASSG